MPVPGDRPLGMEMGTTGAFPRFRMLGRTPESARVRGSARRGEAETFLQDRCGGRWIRVPAVLREMEIGV